MLAAIMTPSKGRALYEGLLECGRNRMDPNSRRGAGRRREGGKAGKAEGPRGEENNHCLGHSGRVCSKRREASYVVAAREASNPHFVSVAVFDHYLECCPFFQRLFNFCGSAWNC